MYQTAVKYFSQKWDTGLGYAHSTAEFGVWSKGHAQTEGKDFQVHEDVFSTMKRHDREAIITCYAQTGNEVINI